MPKIAKISKDCPRSPKIAQDHPRSPKIAQDHPRSPRGPKITQDRPRHCGISGKFLDLISTPISFSLSRLLNNYFEQGSFPEIWKISHVTPIFKKSGLKSDKVNYRPISLLPTLSKICESIVHHRLLSHCEQFSIITSRQAAYLKGDSTINQLITLVNKIKQSWTSTNITHVVFWISKALLKKSGIKVFWLN